MPNALIKREAERAASLYFGKHIGHPFRTPYALFHAWERIASVYLVIPEGDGAPGCLFSAAELQPAVLDNRLVFIISDWVLIERWTPGTYYSRIITSHIYSAFGEQRSAPQAIINNIADPVMLALLLLATDGVEVGRTVPPGKLNRARVKSGKQPIPPHWKIITEPYVTALMQRGHRRTEGKGGTHASPIPHLRRGHLRHLHERHGGATIWIRDALVLIRNGIEHEPQMRAWYARQPPVGAMT